MAEQYAAFLAQLREQGFEEGQNIAVDYKRNDDPRGPFSSAAELMRSSADLVVATGPEVTLQAVIGASRSIPILFLANQYDPIARGYVNSLAHPGGNVTGIFYGAPELAAKQLEILVQTFPERSRLAVLYDVNSADQFSGAEAAAKTMRLQLPPLKLEKPPYDFDVAFQTVANDGAQMVLLLSSPFFVEYHKEIVAAAIAHRLPTMFVFKTYVVDGDGYTIELGHWGTNVVDGAAMSLPFDLLTDFEPIALIASNPLLITSRKDLPAANLKELVSYIKARPGQVTLAEPGAGSPPHVAGTFFEKLTGTNLQFVPYRGGGPALQDLIAGHIDLNMGQAAVALQQISAGTIKAYGVMTENRIAAAPDIPTTDEAGAPGLHLSVWHALWAPKGTPHNVIAKLNAAVVAALADPAVRRRLALIGQDVPPRDQQTPEALHGFQKSEIEKWWPIIKEAGIKVD
jgi:tripartite-type tricarboxylate transporter receptor subunit TctC